MSFLSLSVFCVDYLLGGVFTAAVAAAAGGGRRRPAAAGAETAEGRGNRGGMRKSATRGARTREKNAGVTPLSPEGRFAMGFPNIDSYQVFKV